jgi:hypothetical protein
LGLTKPEDVDQEIFSDIFDEHSDYYRHELKLALMHGNPQAVITIIVNSGEHYIPEESAYEVIRAFVENEDFVDMSGMDVPTDALTVLKLAKKFIDNNCGRVQ